MGKHVLTSALPYVDVRNFGAKGDGVTDDTVALQQAFDYSATNKIKVINNDKNAIFKISSPLYVQSEANIDFNNGEIRKINNVKGVGSNAFNTTLTDSYVVDCHIIIKHNDNDYARNVKIKNVYLGSTVTTPWHELGIFAPRLTQCEFDGIKGQPYKFTRLIKGFLWWLIPVFDNIRMDGGTCIFQMANDGSNAGGSTSINSKQIIGTDMDTCLDLYGLSYSTFDTPLIDHARGTAFIIESCEGLVFNTPSAEWLDSGRYAVIRNAEAVFNSPRSIAIAGATSDNYLWSVDNNSAVVINGGVFADFVGGTPATYSFPMITNNNSHVTLNQTKFPSNANNFNPLTSGSTVTTINSKGIKIEDVNGNGLIVNGRRRLFKTAIPTTGTWAVGDIAYNTVPTAGGFIGWVCVTAGTPGTWKTFGPITS